MRAFLKCHRSIAGAFGFIAITAFALVVSAEPTAQDKAFYRGLTQSIREFAKFQIPLPGQPGVEFSYELEFDQPLWPDPIIGDTLAGYGQEASEGRFYRSFYDKIFLKEGSVLKLNGEEIPLTCVFVAGQDNRFSGDMSPIFPQFVMKVYVVANSYTCEGPLRRGWPETGGKEEAWDTYLYFEIRDPTIMLPTENKLRFRWNEYHSVLIDDGERK